MVEMEDKLKKLTRMLQREMENTVVFRGCRSRKGSTHTQTHAYIHTYTFAILGENK